MTSLGSQQAPRRLRRVQAAGANNAVLTDRQELVQEMVLTDRQEPVQELVLTNRQELGSRIVCMVFVCVCVMIAA